MQQLCSHKELELRKANTEKAQALEEHSELTEEHKNENTDALLLWIQNDVLVTELEALEEIANALVEESQRFTEEAEIREESIEQLHELLEVSLREKS